jgi:hypothetical protein
MRGTFSVPHDLPVRNVAVQNPFESSRDHGAIDAMGSEESTEAS